jgi:RNA polymerase sigma factor (sigma-70 family)
MNRRDLNRNRDVPEEVQRLFAKWIEDYEKVAYLQALHVVKDPQDAQDITQEAFERCWKALRYFPIEKLEALNFRAYLREAVKNLCVGELGRRRKIPAAHPGGAEEALVIEDTHEKSPEQYVLSEEQKQEIVTLINELPGRKGVVVKYVLLGGYDVREIAFFLQLPLRKVTRDLRQGIELLKTKMLRPIQEMGSDYGK